MGDTKQFYSRIAGVSYPNKDGTSRQDNIRKFCKPGQYLILKAEPDNPEDLNATAVFVRTDKGDLQIGYITSDANRTVGGLIGSETMVSARITEITGGSMQKPTRGVNVEIAIGDQAEEAINPKAVQPGNTTGWLVGCLIVIALVIFMGICLTLILSSGSK